MTPSHGHAFHQPSNTSGHEQLPHAGHKPIADMTMVEIASELEKVSGWIENERSKEREARKAYDAVAKGVNTSINSIRHYAQQLVDAQHRRMGAFTGILEHGEVKPSTNGRNGHTGGDIKNLADAILKVWDLGTPEPYTTEEIADALPRTGYKSSAAPASLRSSVNQALAKLCKTGRVIRYRSDGSAIAARDTKSRARKYLSAAKAPATE